MIIEMEGDLLEVKNEIILHQVNCAGVAGGLAGAIFTRNPGAYEKYRTLIEQEADDTGVAAHLAGRCFFTVSDDGKQLIGNLFGQVYPGKDYRPDALRSALKVAADYAVQTRKTVALPDHLSCGICGGNWNEVLGIIYETMKDVEYVGIIKKVD